MKQKNLIIPISLLLCYVSHIQANLFQHERLWPQIKQLDESELSDLISSREKEIEELTKHWKEKLKGKNSNFDGTLIPIGIGDGSTYFLYDKENMPCYVIKPVDEEVFCLNNPKSYASPYFNAAYRVRDHVPLYRTAQTAALAYEFAAILGFGHLTPKTEVGIVSSDQFYSLGKHVGVQEKLCSVQDYVPLKDSLYILADKWVKEEAPDEIITTLIDTEDFENLSLFIWLIYDTDAHAKNIYALKNDAGIYRLIKIDNGLAFPNKNSGLLNALYFLPHAKKTPSKRLRTLIENLPIEDLVRAIRYYEMDGALPAFYQRVQLLQNVIKGENLSFREIEQSLRTLLTHSEINFTK